MKETVSQAHPLLHNVYTVHCVQCIVVYYDPQWSIVEVIVKSIHSNLRCIDQEQFLGEFFLPSSRLTELWGRREGGRGEEKENLEDWVEMGI